MKMRSVFVVLVCMMLVVALVSCNSKDNKSDTVINITALKGPTGIGMAKLLDDSKAGKTKGKYDISLTGAPDEVTGKLISGEIDIAALPANAAATLYNRSNGKVQMLAVNTLGVLYLLEKGNTINSVADLEGKKIYATGQASTPEYVLSYILSKNNVNATVEYKSEHSELAALALSGQADIILLPEPFVTTVLSKSKDFRIALDLTEEFSASVGNDDTKLTMGCLVVNKEFADKNESALKQFLKEYEASAKYASENVDATADLTVKYEIIGSKEIAVKAIPNCSIVFYKGDAMKNTVKGFLQILFDFNKASIGGSIPNDDFYKIISE